jgi:4-amino-4-deoxy-L-arabinose transferase-like glycosyltransferase
VSVEIAGRLTTRQRLLLVALLSTAAIVYALPVGRRPIGVADEARQALLAEDTLRHGLRLPARVRDAPELDKPPLFFWSVALAAVPAGYVSDRNASIPSIVAALATLLGVFLLGRQLSGAHTGFLALAVLATSPGFFLRSHEVRPDMMLTAWLTWALAFFLLGLRSLPPRLGHLAGFYLCVAGALWTKGLVCLMVIPAGVAALTVSVGVRKLPLFRPVTGLALVALTALPWVVPYSRTPGREGSESVSVWHASMVYLDHFQHHPSLPFVDGLVEFLPWTLWLVPAVVWWRLTPERQAYRPVLTWTAAFLFLLGLSLYQRSHYFLPVYPLFALFVAASVTTAGSRARSLLWIHATILIAIIAAVLAVGGWLLLTPRISMPAFVSARSWEAAGLAGLALVGSVTALWSLRGNRSPSQAVSWFAATLALVLLLGSGIYSAGLASTFSIQAFAEGVRGSLERDGPITAYPDGNLVFDFYLDRPIVEVTDRDIVARRLEAPSAGELLLQVNDWAALRRSAHPSWCSMGSVALGSRSYVLLGRCR